VEGLDIFGIIILRMLYIRIKRSRRFSSQRVFWGCLRVVISSTEKRNVRKTAARCGLVANATRQYYLELNRKKSKKSTNYFKLKKFSLKTLGKVPYPLFFDT
jgi:hypothetical protein